MRATSSFGCRVARKISRLESFGDSWYDDTNGMRPGNDDPREDPQETLPPRQHEPRRIVASEKADSLDAGKPSGRRLRLGTPTRLSPARPDPQPPDTSPSVQRGFNLGGADATAETLPASSRKTGVQPWILFVAVGSIILLMAALFLGSSSSGGGAEAAANERLERQYLQYLEAKGHQNNLDVNQRRKEVRERLRAVTWAKALGDRAALESELRGLLVMDNDKNSPLYQYSVNQLMQLGPKKASGF